MTYDLNRLNYLFELVRQSPKTLNRDRGKIVIQQHELSWQIEIYCMGYCVFHHDDLGTAIEAAIAFMESQRVAS